MPLPLVVFHVQDPQGRSIGGARLSATSPDVGPWSGTTNACGDFFANLTPAHYDVTISAPGFKDRLLPADLADCGVVTVGLEPGGSLQPISRARFDGDVLANNAGALPIRSQSFFLGLLRHAMGEDVRPAMRYARDVAGSNTLRVFAYMKYVPEQVGLPVLTPNVGISALSSFLSVAREESLYVEVTAGDAQELQPDATEQRDYFRRVSDVMRERDNSLLLELNEPWKNGLDPFRSLDDAGGILLARGASPDENAPYLPRLDLIDQHTERSLDENGYKWVRHQWEQHNFVRVYHEEPMGCGEGMIDGKRDNEPARFAQASVVGEVSGIGWCFHPEYGIRAEVPASGSRQDACAQAVGAARRWFRPEAQRWAMTRAGLSESALVLDDDHALRAFMRLGANDGQAVAVRPRGYTAVGQNGWRVVKQSEDGAFIDLVR